jgi:hypothetical protein
MNLRKTFIRKRSWLALLMWMSVWVISLLVLLAVLREDSGDFFTDSRTAFGVLLAGIATVGLIFNWGPVVPCSILGAAVTSLFSEPIASSHEQAVFKDLGIPLIEAALGALLGFVIDWPLSHPQIPHDKPKEFEESESNEVAE